MLNTKLHSESEILQQQQKSAVDLYKEIETRANKNKADLVKGIKC